jgi:3-deoxy-7-phosphoheptulonate synthase
MEPKWTPGSWRNFPVKQQPSWPDEKHLKEVVARLRELPSLVFSGETRKLREALTGVSEGNSFILLVGNCAESFSDCHGPKIHNFLRIVLQMALVIKYKTDRQIIKIGRIGGQYAKPRSDDYEYVDGERIPSYRGDMVNDCAPTYEARIPNPDRLLEGYFRSAATLNLIRAFTQGGYNEIKNLRDWKEHFFSKDISKLPYYMKLEKDLTSALENKEVIFNTTSERDQLFVSHEGLLLEYEEAFTRIDTTFGGYYDTSAHLIWIGNRTRRSDGAHVEFARGIGNPIGVKVGPDYNLVDLLTLIKKINPKNEDNKLILISRMGHDIIREKLKPLIQVIKSKKLNVVWVCDPMHGNTFVHNNYKVRSFDHIASEIKSFIEVCNDENVIPGGVHLEITAENVSECIGGINGLTLSSISDNYVTKVDPRLNAAQALEMAFIVSESLNKPN